MKFLRGLWCGLAIAVFATSLMAHASQRLPLDNEEPFRPPRPEMLPPGYDPYRPPVPDRPPDVFYGRPYWVPGPVLGTPLVRTPAGYVGTPLWSVDVGARYFPSTGTTQLNLFAEPPGFAANRIPASPNETCLPTQGSSLLVWTTGPASS